MVGIVPMLEESVGGKGNSSEAGEFLTLIKYTCIV